MSVFSELLYRWHSTIERDLPWKLTKSPYHIWLSEIILQQTRVEQGRPYYLRFIEKWPTIFDLASASEEEVLSLWQGLGYYSRGRNLLQTAKDIVNNYGGLFPKAKNEMLRLKGIGDYTASAILSFAFDLPHPVIDGNVYRVITRYFGIHIPIDTTEGQKTVVECLNSVFDSNEPAKFNQAIMDFGALQCTPLPACNTCPFNVYCKAFQENTASFLPVKSKKIIKKIRHFHFFFIHDQKNFVINQRKEKDIWEGLFQFPLIESEALTDQQIKELVNSIIPYNLSFQKDKPSEGTHILTHQSIKYHIYPIYFESILKEVSKPHRLLPFSQSKNYGFPRLLHKFIEKYLSHIDDPDQD